MRKLISRPKRIVGELSLPGDKSISHRALFFNAIALGKAVVSGLSLGDDVLVTIRCLRQLGVNIQQTESEDTVMVHGCANGALQEPEDVLNAGNSGTTIRLISGILAGQPFLSVLTAGDSLRTRPMDRIVRPLKLMGASIMGRSSDSLPPLAIRGGNLRGIDYSLPVASAQVKSCILLAGIFAKGESRVLQPAVTRDHTERMLRSMGAHVITDGLSVTIKPGLLSCVDVRVPGDISSAAFWLVLGACHPNAEFALKGVGVNPTRGGVIQVLKSMGADIRLANQREEGGEPLADISVRSSRLVATTIAGDVVPNVIDEIPVLALAACFAHGTTVIRDAQELRVKESDRIASVAHELSLLGARIYEMPDGMAIQGPAQLKGTVTNSHGDHRLAMTLGVAGALADGQTVVEKAEENSKSYPGFWEDLGRLLTEGV